MTARRRGPVDYNALSCSLRDPNDVLIEAERLKKKLAEEAAKKQVKKRAGVHQQKQK